MALEKHPIGAVCSGAVHAPPAPHSGPTRPAGPVVDLDGNRARTDIRPAVTPHRNGLPIGRARSILPAHAPVAELVDAQG